jgi:transcriptional regulator with XRE-family HTH domain
MYSILEKEIESRGLTYRKLILKAGLIYTTVQPKLRGKRHVGDITLHEATKIKEALGVDMKLEDLFAEDVEEAEQIS